MDPDSYFLSLRKRLAFLLAKAGCEVFPDAEVVSIEGTGSVFFADFCFSQTFDPAFLPLIEQRFREIIGQNPEIEILEAVGASARGLLERGKQSIQVAKLPPHPQLLVTIGVIKDFALLIPESLQTEPHEKFFWEIVGFCDGGFVDGEPVVRIMGIACEDLAGIKEAKKFWAKHPYVPPGSLAVQGQFLAPLDESWLWLPRGESLRLQLFQAWQNRALDAGYRFVSTGGNFPFEQGLEELIEASKGESLAFAECSYAALEEEPFHMEGLLTPAGGWTDRMVRICPKEKALETCFSSLQFILQIPRILSFEEQIVLCSSLSGDVKDLRKAADAAGVDYRCEVQPDREFSSLEVRISDRLGRWWTVSSMWIGKKQPIQGHRAVFVSCFGKWERFAGLLIEKEITSLEKLNSKLAATGKPL